MQRNRTLIVMWSLLCALAGYLPAQSAAQIFPELKQWDIPDYEHPYDNPFKGRIHYDPAITKLLKNVPRPTYMDPSVKQLTTKIDRNKDLLFDIYFNPGPSGDPAFGIGKAGTGWESAKFYAGMDLYIPGNGAVYVSGHTNSMFNYRKKYELKGDKLVAVKQPFWYVGLDTTTQAAITIYSDKQLTSPVAAIPKGSNLSVILNEGKFYLIKTPFGLLGWIKYDYEGNEDNGPIKGLYYNGD